MTYLQAACLWNCAMPVGVSTAPGGMFTRQLNWLFEHGYIYKRKGRWYANRDGKRMALYQTEGWETTSAAARKALANSLRRKPRESKAVREFYAAIERGETTYNGHW